MNLVALWMFSILLISSCKWVLNGASILLVKSSIFNMKFLHLLNMHFEFCCKKPRPKLALLVIFAMRSDHAVYLIVLPEYLSDVVSFMILPSMKYVVVTDESLFVTWRNSHFSWLKRSPLSVFGPDWWLQC